MTSGVFTSFPVDQIYFDRAKRQRREINNIDDLATSISGRGLIHPIVIQRNGELVAGERRLTAVRQLGWTHIPVQFVDTLDEKELLLIELEENVKRVDMTWQDRVLAINAYHEARAAEEPEWSQEDTANELGFTRQSIGDNIRLAKAIVAGVDEVVKAPQYSVAHNILQRKQKREKDAELVNLRTPAPAPVPELIPSVAPPPTQGPILNMSFLDFAPNFSGVPFNFLHCDFPYGVNIQDSAQGGGIATGTYDDSEEVYWGLIRCLGENIDRIVAPSAHMMFWFSMKFYQQTIDALTAQGWTVNPTPLIWVKSDNRGILPDHRRGPRQIYETALLCSRGDRHIVRAVANAFNHPTTREIHMSEKPVPMLQHFFRMFVDETTTFFDPTAGSGTSLRAARAFGAKTIVGLELDPTFATSANAAYLRKDNGSSEVLGGDTGALEDPVLL